MTAAAITLAHLQAKCAGAGQCADVKLANQYAEFQRLFGDSVVVTPTVFDNVASTFDWYWAAEHLLSATSLANFDRARRVAEDAYNKIRAPAQAKYDYLCDAARADHRVSCKTAKDKYGAGSGNAASRTQVDMAQATYEADLALARADFTSTCDAASATFRLACARAFASCYLDDHQERPNDAEDEWVRSYHERIRKISVMDGLDGVPPCPRLPADLDDPAALENWSAAWNAWIINEAVQLQRPLLKPMTTETVAGIARAEKRARAYAARSALNILEARLKASDSRYDEKRSLLVPILKPILQRLPPSAWASAFEQAYSQARIPSDEHEKALPPGTRSADATPIRVARYVASVLVWKGSLLVPYFVVAWIIIKVTGLSSRVVLPALIAVRLSFNLFDSMSGALYWLLGGRASAVNYWLRFLQHNDFPTQRHYRHDDIGNYLCRIQDDSSMNPRLRISAKEMTTRLAAFWEIGMFTGMRGRSAAEAALEIHAPRATAPELSSGQ